MYHEEDIGEILKIKRHFPNSENCLLWTNINDGKFTVKSCHILTSNANGLEETSMLWKKLWNNPLHERLKMFIWRLANEVLLTKSILGQRVGCRDLLCSLCGLEEETTTHLFRDCHISWAVAFAWKWGFRLGFFEGLTIEGILN